MAKDIKAAILAAQDQRVETVHVPEWGMDVRVRALTGAERDKFEDSMVKAGKNGAIQMSSANFRARFLVLCIVDESGERVFEDAEAGALGTKSAGALSRLYNVASALSGMSPEDEASLLKNFPNGQNGASTSA